MKRVLVWLGFFVAAHSAVSSWLISISTKPHQWNNETSLAVGGLGTLTVGLNALLAKHFFSERTTLPYGMRVAASFGVTAAIGGGILLFYLFVVPIMFRVVRG